MKTTWMGRAFWLLVLITVTGVMALAQKDSTSSLECREQGNNDRMQRHCEMREQAVAAGETTSVNAIPNGGIRVKGSDRNDILLRARVEAAAPTVSEAAELAKQVKIETAGSRIKASGPAVNAGWWSVSFELLVPRRSNLTLATHNGGISIADVNGRIDFNAMNGGVFLQRVGGRVHGSATNGGLVVELDGSQWNGEELNVKTTNGGVVMSIPDNYSARLETGTVNGHVSSDFPIAVQGNLSKEISITLGSGGPTVRAMTTNGSVRLKRAARASESRLF